MMVTERWDRMGGRDGGRVARLGVRAVYVSRLYLIS